MFESVHRRLTLFLTCILATGAILLATAAGFLLFTQKQASENAEASFNVELDGRPLLYAGNGDGERGGLIAEAKAAALSGQGLDLSLPPTSNIQTQEARYVFTGRDGGRYRAAAAVIPLSSGWAGVVVVRSTAPESVQLTGQLALLGSVTLGGLCLLALFAWFFTRRALRPIEENQRKQLEFVHAASHELRSPLAVIQASLSALKTAEPGEREHFIALADGECTRMSRLVGDLLALAGADSGQWTIRPAQVELETLVLNVCEGFEGPARHAGIRLEPRLPAAPLPPCRCDGERVAQVLSILLDNALAYTPAGGRVTVGVDRGGRGFLLTVSDTGPGIPDGEKAHIFDRFYRADPSRSKREHYGLGLCIAREIAGLHRGSLTVGDRPGGGAVFTLALPG